MTKCGPLAPRSGWRWGSMLLSRNLKTGGFSGGVAVSRGAQNFRQRDVQRAVKAAEAVGKTVLEIRVDKTGAHIVVAGDEDKTKREGNTWDDL